MCKMRKYNKPTEKSDENENFPVDLFTCVPQHVLMNSYLRIKSLHNDVLLALQKVILAKLPFLCTPKTINWEEKLRLD